MSTTSAEKEKYEGIISEARDASLLDEDTLFLLYYKISARNKWIKSREAKRKAVFLPEVLGSELTWNNIMLNSIANVLQKDFDLNPYLLASELEQQKFRDWCSKKKTKLIDGDKFDLSAEGATLMISKDNWKKVQELVAS